jgi:hypothetical protein
MRMAKKTTTPKSNEYVHVDGETVSAYAGTELDKVYAKDEDYTRVTGSTPTPEATTADAREGEQPVDLDGLSRDQLDQLAAEKGVDDPASLPNKDAVKAAIAEATTADEGEE